ncbi:MAG: Uma2 family endonuclease [Pyrinomonadaceae bacterium]
MNEKIVSQSEKLYTVEDYLNSERHGLDKHEFSNGKISSAAGSSRRHNLIGSNTTIAIGSRVRGQKCEVYVNDMRVKLTQHNYCYPDVIVTSGEPKFEGNELDILLNPTVIVEILSKSTLYYDKTDKLDCYLAMNSVKEVLLVREEEMRVEHYAKQTINQWVYRIYNTNDSVVSLDSINCKINLSEIYAQIKFI